MKASDKSPREAGELDRHIGKQLRVARQMIGLSQTALGEAVGVTFQQIQKYERGTNRIPASRLHVFADTLQVPMSFFFDGAQRTGRKADAAAASSFGDYPNLKADVAQEVLQSLNTMSPKVRYNIIETIRTVAQERE
ncbi:XRE family transcriptional regulator [Marinicauda algicola]|uniref:XRE family transcriptional regulator n=1 Tax=Marinicauda algicola TaxID=2029849 RepID=A0A4S2GYN1_9PROT|nr:helix-turn-helix transcriptional regulator [Marinicauda algicola]TGY88193.1 XRE family transcriptional regulator [Marinicauda algicola]